MPVEALPAGLGLPILTAFRILPIMFDGYNPQARIDASFVPAPDLVGRRAKIT